MKESPGHLIPKKRRVAMRRIINTTTHQNKQETTYTGNIRIQQRKKGKRKKRKKTKPNQMTPKQNKTDQNQA
jgi:hypothetical protein